MTFHTHPTGTPSTPQGRLKRWLFGAPHDLTDRSTFHRIALVPLLAWIGLGADGLSSSSYGPEEAFRTLGQHTSLAIALALMVAGTIFLIAQAYGHIIERFPSGGGGYLVASNLLGPRTGVVSGSALVVDYVLTIAVSIASAGDAIFSFLPVAWLSYRLGIEVVLILFLVLLNLRGVRESVVALAPVFVAFVVTHLVLIVGTLALHVPEIPATAVAVKANAGQGLATLGLGGMLFLLMHAYSMGAGTYTGLEAVSNGLPILREPRVQTARRTMTYMAVSLAFTAAGLIVCYLLMHVSVVEGKTLNAILAERFAGTSWLARVFVILTLLSEGGLLVVAAQAGFLDGPRVLANMAGDYWLPRRFTALSDRLTTRNGVLLMGAAALAALLYTHGDVRALVVMYSINVFLTFTLSMFGMLRETWRTRARGPRAWRRVGLFAATLALCASILVVTVVSKFAEGGWLTLVVTGALIALCFAVKRHYSSVRLALGRLFPTPAAPVVEAATPEALPDPDQPVAALLVAGYSGVGVESVRRILEMFPDHFKGIVFLSVGVLDSNAMKEAEATDLLRERTEESLATYEALAASLGMPATSRYALGTDAGEEAEALCLGAAVDYPSVTFFAGKVVFQNERWYHRLLHNEMANAIHHRLQHDGIPMVVLPTRV